MTSPLFKAFMAAAAGLAAVSAVPAEAQHFSAPSIATHVAVQTALRNASHSNSTPAPSFAPDAQTARNIVLSPDSATAVRRGLPTYYAKYFNSCVAPGRNASLSAAQAGASISCMKDKQNDAALKDLGLILGATALASMGIVGAAAASSHRDRRRY